MEITISREKIIVWLWSILYLIILLSNIIEQKLSFVNYIDETIAIISMFYILINFKVYIHDSSLAKITIALLFVCIIGVLGNLFFKFQDNNIAIAKDMLAMAKTPIIAMALIIRKKISKNDVLDDKILISTQKISKIYLCILFVFGLLSLFDNTLGLTYDLRYGIYSYKFLYSHPTFLVYAVVIISVNLMAKSQEASIYVYQSMVIFLLIISMRDKAFAYALLLFIILILKKFDINTIKARYFFLAAVIALLVSKGKINEYRSYTWSPREALLKNGFSLAKMCFPLGSGFASFGGMTSGEYYSSAYGLFGMNMKDGTSPMNYIDLGDSGLPYYYASFGFIGFFVFFYIIFEIFKKAYYFYVGNSDKVKAMMLILGYLLICLPFENFLTNESGATVMLILFVFIGSTSKSIKQLANRH